MISPQSSPQNGRQGCSQGEEPGSAQLEPPHLLPPPLALLLNIPTAGPPAVLGQHRAGFLLLEAGQQGAPLQPQPGQPCVVQNHCHHLPGALQQGTSILSQGKTGRLRLWDGDLREASQTSPRSLQGRWARERLAPPRPLHPPQRLEVFLKTVCHITSGPRPREPLLLTGTAPGTHLGFLRPSAGLHCFYRLFEE